MVTSTLTLENEREILSQAIVEVVGSWPDLHRRIFTQIHYAGKSIEETSRLLSLTGGEVRQILAQCERKLRQALKSFRRVNEDATSVSCHVSPPCFSRP